MLLISRHEIKMNIYRQAANVLTAANHRLEFQSIVIVLFCLFVCLFSWRYNQLWLYFHSPVAGFSLLGFEVS
jgi:hypothetical protein